MSTKSVFALMKADLGALEELRGTTIRAHRSVIYVLADQARKLEGWSGYLAWPGEARIAYYCDLTTRSVRESLCWARKHKLITLVARPRGAGRGRPQVYRIELDLIRPH